MYSVEKNLGCALIVKGQRYLLSFNKILSKVFFWICQVNCRCCMATFNNLNEGEDMSAFAISYFSHFFYLFFLLLLLLLSLHVKLICDFHTKYKL